jgi:Cysteine rich repeat
MTVRNLVVAAASAIALLSLSSPAPAQMAEVMKYCKGDAERLCPGVQPGGGRIIKCLKAHEMEMSIGCGKTLQKIKAQMNQ